MKEWDSKQAAAIRLYLLPLLLGLRLYLVESQDQVYGVANSIWLFLLASIGIWLTCLLRKLKTPLLLKHLDFITIWVAGCLSFSLLILGGRDSITSFSQKGLPYCFLACLLTIAGSYLGQLVYGGPLGFKLPWTLADRNIWQKTHQMAGRLWQIIGFILGLCGVVGISSSLILNGLMLIALITPLLYGKYIQDKKL